MIVSGVIPASQLCPQPPPYTTRLIRSIAVYYLVLVESISPVGLRLAARPRRRPWWTRRQRATRSLSPGQQLFSSTRFRRSRGGSAVRSHRVPPNLVTRSPRNRISPELDYGLELYCVPILHDYGPASICVPEAARWVGGCVELSIGQHEPRLGLLLGHRQQTSVFGPLIPMIDQLTD